MDEIYILIPSLDPDDKLIQVITSLKKYGFNNILLVDDGSENKELFNKAKDEFSCEVITHTENKGKGRALKTGFNHILSISDNVIKGVVTVDGDNQHKAKDVLSVSRCLSSTYDTLVLGVRQFKGVENVPPRSRVGNEMSACVFRILSGESISDTQTGLRGIPFSHLEKFIKLDGERFEYEMNVLLQLRKLGLKLEQIPIETVYLGENESSHFRPIADSICVFGSILKFATVGIISFFIDYILFTFLLYFVFKIDGVFLSSLVARVVSSLVNFLLNYNVVFKSSGDKASSLFKYYTLAIVQMLLSSYGTVAGSLVLSPLVAKPIVDLVLFFVSYYVQKKFIFNNKRSKF